MEKQKNLASTIKKGLRTGITLQQIYDSIDNSSLQKDEIINELSKYPEQTQYLKYQNRLRFNFYLTYFFIASAVLISFLYQEERKWLLIDLPIMYIAFQIAPFLKYGVHFSHFFAAVVCTISTSKLIINYLDFSKPHQLLVITLVLALTVALISNILFLFLLHGKHPFKRKHINSTKL